MNISLPPKLKQFVEQKVSEGLYENPTEVVREALRDLQKKEKRFIIDPFTEKKHVEALVVTGLRLAVKDIDEDLSLIMAEIRSMISTKQKLRRIISKVNYDVSNNLGRRKSGGSLKFHSTGMGSELAYHTTQMPVADLNAEGGVQSVQRDLYKGRIDDVEILISIRDELKLELDSLSDMSTLETLRLQSIMDKRAKCFETLSNVMKKLNATQDTVVQNLK
jgi:putative addiction module CopG family antidote